MGDNKVTCDKYDCKCATKKDIRFLPLSHFLGIHLRRCTFNYNTLQGLQINKKISFPLYFNAKQYLNIDAYNVDFDLDKNDTNTTTMAITIITIGTTTTTITCM